MHKNCLFFPILFSYWSHQFYTSSTRREKKQQISMLCAAIVQRLFPLVHTDFMQKKQSGALFSLYLRVPCNGKCFIENTILPYLLKCLTCIFRSIVCLYGIYVCTLSMENSSAQPHPARTRTSQRAYPFVRVRVRSVQFSSLFSLFIINFLLFPSLALTCVFYHHMCMC